jgi:hypothetical protein
MDINNLTMCTQRDCVFRGNCLRFADITEFPENNFFISDPREKDGHCNYYIAPNQLNFNFE